MDIVEARADLCDWMFDQYVSGNDSVITEIEANLADIERNERLLTMIRIAMTKECELPRIGRGGIIYDRIRAEILGACMEYARRLDTIEEINAAFESFGGAW